jgi:hypothetical protein
MIYDTIYAHQVYMHISTFLYYNQFNPIFINNKDKKDDLKLGIKSTALKFSTNTFQILSFFNFC